MLKIHEIREIIKLLDQSSLQEFEMEGDGVRLSIKKGGKGITAAAVQEEIPVQPTPSIVAAPAVQQPVANAAHAPVPETAAAPRPADKPQQAPADDHANLHKIVSPMVGTFYSKPDPNSPVFVKPGDRINQDSIVCIVEAMKLFNEIEAEVSGEIVKVLAEDGQLVEYGQPLFLVKA